MSRLGTAEEADIAALTPSPGERYYVLLMRVLALYALLFCLAWWVRLVGVHDGPLWRFDLMPQSWKFAAVSLAALYACAAIGLWLTANWGPVLWVIAAGAEIVMFTLLSDTFGWRPLTAAAHGAGMVALFGFWVTMRWQKYRRRQRLH